MIGLDTNVLLRYLIEDDQKQTEQAANLILKTVKEKEELYISDIVLCEMVWVLKRSYHKSRTEIIEILRTIFKSDSLVFDSYPRLNKTLDAFENGKGDFSDYLIREEVMEKGRNALATFDRCLINEPGFLEP